MKFFTVLLCCGILLCASLTPCFAQGKTGKYGLGIKDTISEANTYIVTGRYWLADQASLDVNFGFNYKDVDNGSDDKHFLIGAGINQYLLAPQKFSPFVGLDFSVEAGNDIPLDETDTSIMVGIDGKFGGEYFFTDRFSLSGEVLLGIHLGEDNKFGTGGRLGVLFYLN